MDHFSENNVSQLWLDQEGQIFEYSAQAPAPSKDFCQVVVTPVQVIFRWWKITHRNAEGQRLHPGEIKECYEDFLHDDRTQSMISCAFGEHMLDYVINLCHGHLDYIQRLPANVMRNILKHVDLEDIARVSMLNKSFHQFSNDDELWRQMFANATAITEELEDLAKEQGWKKLYFSNKLQIQMQLQRKRRTEGDGTDNKKTFLTHAYHDEVQPRN
ncbi:F-box only protein 36-like [Watersipora subatra]|uniref:F-box only protein 36-like n=1 Tax=Watersipora subatra TaxID=2589382 RepID=UPI00355B3DEF